MKTIRRKTMVELLAAIYEANGWKRKAGESRTARVSALYDVRICHQRGDFVAKPRPTAVTPETVLDRFKKLH